MTALPTLIVGPSWVGDMVMAQSLFVSLKQADAAAAIDVLAPGWSLPVIARMPQVRRGIEMPATHGEFKWGARRQLGIALRSENYGRAIVLPRSFKSALVPFHARVPVRTGYRGEMRYGLVNDMRRLDKRLLTTTVSRYVALGLRRDAPKPPQIPQPVLRVDSDNQARVLSELGLTQDHRIVCLLPGAEYGPAKQWPVDHYAQLAKRLAEGGRNVWVIGAEKEQEAGDTIAAKSPAGVRNLCGKTTLADAIDLIAAADAAVSNDSGLMHVAAATGRPLVAIYGSSSPDYTPPLSDQAHIEYLNIECSPCFERTCRFGHYRCLQQIGVDAVLQALAAFPPRG